VPKPAETGRKVVATNRRARYDYDILETFECGLVLQGSEVKSLRAGQVQLKDSYAELRGAELWLANAHIAPYQFARDGGHEPERPRKLLLHRREVERLVGKIKEAGLTLVPLSMYFTHGLAKVEVGLARGRRTIDKRNKIREREQQREMDRARRHRR
jgi:SsrA-binding protein